MGIIAYGLWTFDGLTINFNLSLSHICGIRESTLVRILFLNLSFGMCRFNSPRSLVLCQKLRVDA